VRIGIHPFPARMAPELAMNSLGRLPLGSTVLDPMSGSGTVARQAVELGLTAHGFDLDPLAVLISKVVTAPVEDDAVASAATTLLDYVATIDPSSIALPWIDGDVAAEKFIEYWFAESQRQDLRKLAYALHHADQLGLSQEQANALRLSLSRIIVTKKQCASLAQDTSHSRPHRVATESNYDVLNGFRQAVIAVRKRLRLRNIRGHAHIERGDARELAAVGDATVDAVLTSPPYLNAIDYMRGHRLSLIWLGHTYHELAGTRSDSIGAEKRLNGFDESLTPSLLALGAVDELPPRYQGMVRRYVSDLHKMVGEVSRVLKKGAEATFVMGNSCLKGIFIRNSEALAESANTVELQLTSRLLRELPAQHRYLPTPTEGALAKRMRHEVVLTFAKA
jgi:hypothetical protein